MSLTLTVLGHSFGIRLFHWGPEDEDCGEVVSDGGEVVSDGGQVELADPDGWYADDKARMGFGPACNAL